MVLPMLSLGPVKMVHKKFSASPEACETSVQTWQDSASRACSKSTQTDMQMLCISDAEIQVDFPPAQVFCRRETQYAGHQTSSTTRRDVSHPYRSQRQQEVRVYVDSSGNDSSSSNYSPRRQSSSTLQNKVARDWTTGSSSRRDDVESFVDLLKEAKSVTHNRQVGPPVAVKLSHYKRQKHDEHNDRGIFKATSRHLSNSCDPSVSPSYVGCNRCNSSANRFDDKIYMKNASTQVDILPLVIARYADTACIQTDVSGFCCARGLDQASHESDSSDVGSPRPNMGRRVRAKEVECWGQANGDRQRCSPDVRRSLFKVQNAYKDLKNDLTQLKSLVIRHISLSNDLLWKRLLNASCWNDLQETADVWLADNMRSHSGISSIATTKDNPAYTTAVQSLCCWMVLQLLHLGAWCMLTRRRVGSELPKAHTEGVNTHQELFALKGKTAPLTQHSKAIQTESSLSFVAAVSQVVDRRIALVADPLRLRITDLTNDLLARDAAIVGLKQQVDEKWHELVNNKRETSEVLDELENSLVAEKQAASRLIQELARSNELLAASESHKRSLVDELSSMKHKNAALETELVHVSKAALRMQHAETTLQQLTDKVQSLETLQMSTKQELQSAQQRLLENEKELADAQIKVSTLGSVNDQACKTFEEEKRQLSDKFTKELQDVYSESELQIERLRSANRELQARVCSLDTSLCQLNQQCVSKISENESARKTVATLQESLEHQQQLIQKLRLEVAFYLGLDCINAERSNKSFQPQRLTVESSKEREILCQESHCGKRSASASPRTPKTQHQEFHAFMSAQDGLEETFKKLVERFNHKRQEFDTELQAANMRHNSLLADISNLRDQLELLKQEKCTLQAEVVVQKSTVETLRYQMDRLAAAEKAVAQSSRELEKERSSYVEKLKQADVRYIEVIQQMKRLSTESKMVMDERDELKRDRDANRHAMAEGKGFRESLNDLDGLTDEVLEDFAKKNQAEADARIAALRQHVQNYSVSVGGIDSGGHDELHQLRLQYTTRIKAMEQSREDLMEALRTTSRECEELRRITAADTKRVNETQDRQYGTAGLYSQNLSEQHSVSIKLLSVIQHALSFYHSTYRKPLTGVQSISPLPTKFLGSLLEFPSRTSDSRQPIASYKTFRFQPMTTCQDVWHLPAIEVSLPPALTPLLFGILNRLYKLILSTTGMTALWISNYKANIGSHLSRQSFQLWAFATAKQQMRNNVMSGHSLYISFSKDSESPPSETFFESNRSREVYVKLETSLQGGHTSSNRRSRSLSELCISGCQSQLSMAGKGMHSNDAPKTPSGSEDQSLISWPGSLGSSVTPLEARLVYSEGSSSLQISIACGSSLALSSTVGTATDSSQSSPPNCINLRPNEIISYQAKDQASRIRTEHLLSIQKILKMQIM